MVIKQWIDKYTTIVKKYRYVLIILLIGILLLTLPQQKRTSVPSAEHTNNDVLTTETIENRISKILSKVDGAGKVEVILTVAAGEEIIYQADVDDSSGENSTTERSNTIIITDAERTQSGLIKQVNPVTYKGAIILCRGADDPAVRLKLINAVSNLTGLGTNCISVLKLK